MAMRVVDAVLAVLGAVVVLACGLALGVAYHHAHQRMWDAGVWFPVLPGMVLGLLVAVMVSLWSNLVGPGRKWLAKILAAITAIIVGGARFTLDGLGLRAKAPNAGLVELIQRYLDVEAGRKFIAFGNQKASDSHELYWILLGLEVAALFFAGVLWMRTEQVDPAFNETKSRVRRVGSLLVVLVVVGSCAFAALGSAWGAGWALDAQRVITAWLATSPTG